MKKQNQKRLSTRQLVPGAFIMISMVWIFIGLRDFGFFNKLEGGTPGFLPVVAASIMLLGSVAALAKSFGEDRPRYTPLCFGFLAMCAGVVALSYLIGLLPALLLFVLLWIRVIEKNGWKGTLLVLAVLAAVGYGLFAGALQVPFPKGLLLNMLG